MVGSEAGDEGAAVDIIKGRGEQPVVFGILDLEAAVLGDAVSGV